MTRPNGSSDKLPVQEHAITTLSVAGFKSILDEQTIEIRPLTLLAGANSSGKSSMMQPLLLLKQTLEAPYDPGPLLLNGHNVKFTSISQFWPSQFGQTHPSQSVVTVGTSNRMGFTVAFRRDTKGFAVDYNIYNLGAYRVTVGAHSSADEILKELREILQNRLDTKSQRLVKEQMDSSRPEIIRSRFFLEIINFQKEPNPGNEGFSVPSILSPRSIAFERLVQRIMEVVHLPGLRGNPERTYPLTAVGPTFPGTFENYVASLVAHWKSESPGRIKDLSDDP